MFCRNCGTQLDENAKFCVNCGTAVEVAQPTVEVSENAAAQDKSSAEPSTTAYNPEENAYYNTTAEPVSNCCASEVQPDSVVEEQKSSLASKILTFGILGLAFAMSCYLSVLGIIFSGIAKSKVSQYIALYGETEGKASVGKNLATAGLIVGILGTVFMAIYFIIIVAALMMV